MVISGPYTSDTPKVSPSRPERPSRVLIARVYGRSLSGRFPEAGLPRAAFFLLREVDGGAGYSLLPVDLMFKSC